MTPPPSKEYKQMLQLISRNGDKLLATMTDSQKELFAKYTDCVRDYQVMAECMLFQNSFRLGAKMMLAVLGVEHRKINRVVIARLAAAQAAIK